MSIQVELSVSGLCLMVRQRDRRTVSIVMPDARKGGTDTMGKPLEVHEPTLTYRDVKYPLRGTFSFGAGGADIDSVRQSGFVPLDAIAPGHGPDRRFLDDGAKGVVARIDLLGGKMGVPTALAFCEIDPRFPQSRIEDGWFAWTAVWNLDGVQDAQLEALRRLRSDDGSTLDLPTSGRVELTIANLPKHAHGERHGPSEELRPGQHDTHFRWFYELARGRGGLQGKHVPLPKLLAGPVPPSGDEHVLSPGTSTCFGAWGDP